MDMNCVNLHQIQRRFSLIIMKNFIAKLIQKTGYEISRLPEKSSHPANEYFQLQRFLSGVKQPVIFDVGAHVGKMTKRYRNIFPDAEIYAFEPIPECFNQIRELSKSDGKIHIYQTALSNQSGDKDFYIYKNSASSSLLLSTEEGRRKWGNGALEIQSQITVQCNTLDGFCDTNNIDKIHLLKLDIQGAEFEVLTGAEGLLRSGSVDIIFTEISILKSYTNQGGFHEILSTLNEHGFELYNIYKAIRREGRLMEIDVMFIRSDLIQYH